MLKFQRKYHPVTGYSNASWIEHGSLSSSSGRYIDGKQTNYFYRQALLVNMALANSHDILLLTAETRDMLIVCFIFCCLNMSFRAIGKSRGMCFYRLNWFCLIHLFPGICTFNIALLFWGRLKPAYAVWLILQILVHFLLEHLHLHVLVDLNNAALVQLLLWR